LRTNVRVQAPLHKEPLAALSTRFPDQGGSRRGEVEGVRSVLLEQPVGSVPHLLSLGVAALVEENLQEGLCRSSPFMA
jgi:hypothetical protein